MDGILLIDKDKNCTSRDVVNIVSKKLGIKKVGHTGTLDPIATGVLVICIGKATKVVDLITSLEKEYIAEVLIGKETDTGDITGNIIKETNIIPSEEEIKKSLNLLKGSYYQEVPIYSAVKINGKKLYEYARENQKVDLPKRLVNIKEIELVSNIYKKDNDYYFKFKCLVSKGTYIRSLIKDICENLNICGCMSNLRRTKQGSFSIENCINVKELDNIKLIKIEDVLNIKRIEVDDYLSKKIKNGQILENRYNEDKVMFMYNNKLLAIYQVYEKDKSKVKPYRMFGG